jgi:TPR repeat protein
MKPAILLIGLVWGTMAWGAEPPKEIDRAKLEARAAKNDVAAQFELAHALYWADGRDRDLEASAKWARRAAKAGNAKAQFLHAIQLLLAHGVKGDSKAAIKLLIQAGPGIEKAALQGDAQALYISAQLYFRGCNSVNNFKLDVLLARKQLKAAAEKGNSEAIYLLALDIFKQYKQAPKDPKNTPKLAAQWLLRAAEVGHPFAAKLLGDLLYSDLLGPRKPKEAARWLKQAAEFGLDESQFLYARLLESGDLGAVDQQTALKWYRRAAMQGHQLSQENLVDKYFHGKFVEKDFEQAYMWLTLLERQGNSPPLALKIKQTIITQLSPDQQLAVLQRADVLKIQVSPVTENDSMGLLGCSLQTQLSIRAELFEWRIRKGDVEAALVLGMEYLDRAKRLTLYHLHLRDKAGQIARNGTEAARLKAQELMRRAEQDEKAANEFYADSVRLLTIAAEKDLVVAQHNLAALYLFGRGTKKNPAMTAKWYERAAKLKDPQAMSTLADLYVEGNFLDKNLQRGFELYLALAETGNAGAQNNLAVMYLEGAAVGQDLPKAEEFFRKSARQGYSEAQKNLGTFMIEGHSRKGIDHVEAVNWFTLSARQGNAGAQIALSTAYHFGDGVAKKNSRLAYEWLLIAGESFQRTLRKTRNPDYVRALKMNLELVAQNKRKVAAALSSKEIEAAGERAAKFAAINLYHPNQAAAGDSKAIQAKANRGDSEAQFQLGILHVKGLNGPADLVQAYKWLTLAKDAGHALAEAERDALSQSMKNEQIIAAKRLARKFEPVKLEKD